MERTALRKCNESGLPLYNIHQSAGPFTFFDEFIYYNGEEKHSLLFVVPLRTLYVCASFSTDIPAWTNVCQHPVLKLFYLKTVIKYSLSLSVKEYKLQNN